MLSGGEDDCKRVTYQCIYSETCYAGTCRIRICDKESRFRESNGGQTSNLYTLYFPKKVEEEWKEEEQEESEQFSMKQSDYEEVCETDTESGAEEGKKRCVEDRINVSEMKMVYSGKKFRKESAAFLGGLGRRSV